MKKERLAAAILFTVMLAAASLNSIPAQATTTQTRSCVDGGGTTWKVRSVWGNEYRNASGVKVVSNDLTGFTTSSPAATTVDYSVKTYNSAGTLLQTLTEQDRRFNFSNGSSYLNRNPVNPPSAPGKARIVVNLGDGNDGFGNCTMTFVQPPTETTASTKTAVLNGWGTVTAGDEFNYTGAPDSSKWSVYNGPGHSGNGRRVPENVTVNGSALDMKGEPDGDGGGMSSRFDRDGSSGEVVGAVSGGRWETRMKVTGPTASTYRSTGWHPVLIVWPDAGRVDANNCQEMDYSESTSDVTLMKTYNHYECPNVQEISASKVINMREWHNYAVEWKSDLNGTRPGWVKNWVDGVLLYSTTDAVKVMDAKSHSTIQLDNFLGDLGESHLSVDWTRYYSFN